MPRGARPGERRGGRAKGTPNKKHTERQIIEASLKSTIKTKEDAERAKIAALAVQAAKREGGAKLAKDKLEEYMATLEGMAGFYQPRPPTQQANKNENFDRFITCLDLAVYCAKELAQYQSPKLRAVMIAAPPPKASGEKVTRFTLGIFDNQGREALPQGALPASKSTH